MKVTCGTRTHFEHVEKFDAELEDTNLPEGWVTVPVKRSIEDDEWYHTPSFNGIAIYLCPEHIDADLTDEVES